MKNFKFNYTFLALFFGLSFLISSCSDDDEVKPTATITLTSPTDPGLIASGNVLKITGTIAGNQEIHGYVINIRDVADNSIMYTTEVHDHAKDITINQEWTAPAVTSKKMLNLEIIATLDHDGKAETKTVALYLVPAGQTNFATINITAPVTGQEVHSNQAVAIKGNITGFATLHGYKLKLRRTSDNFILDSADVHDHNKDIVINQTLNVGAITTHTELELEVIATLDHDGNTESKKVSFHAMP